MKIGIIGAMEQEVALLREQLLNCTTSTDAGLEFYSGELNGHEIILTKSGIGKVAAAMAASLLLERFSPEIVINTGSAGGYDPQLNVGDIVISNEVRHHDVDLTVFGYEIGQVPQMPAAFNSDTKLIALAQKSFASLGADVLGDIKAVEGLICTGDTFMNDPVKVEYARNNFPTMIAVEMEAAAIAQVCHLFKIPFVVIRSLSDIAGKESGQSFEEYLVVASKHSSALVIEMLKQI